MLYCISLGVSILSNYYFSIMICMFMVIYYFCLLILERRKGVKDFFISALQFGWYSLLAGGLAYTAGAILYGIGSRRRWFHSVFHVFVVLGSLLQFFAFYFYGI